MGEFDPRTKFQGVQPIRKALLAPTAGDRTGVLRSFGRSLRIDTGVGQLIDLTAASYHYGVNPVPWNRRVQEGYNPFDDAETLRGYEQWFEEFERATSPEEVEMIKHRIDVSAELRHSIQDFGGTRFVANIFDPINMVPIAGALGKGFSAGAKMAMGSGIAPFAASELVRHGIDPTATVLETTLNIAGGTVFMGLMGGAMGKWSPDPEAIRVGRLVDRGVDLIIGDAKPIHGTAHMSIGIPMGYGTLGRIFGRVTSAFKSTANAVGLKGESNGKKIQRKDGQGPRGGADDANPGPRVDAEWHPKQYLESGATRALQIHEKQKADLDQLKANVLDDDHIQLRSQQSGRSTADTFTALNRQVDELEAEVKKGDEFFAREDVQKHVQLEKEIGPEAARKKDLSEYELVNDQTLDIIDGLSATLRNEIREFQGIVKFTKLEIKESKARIEILQKKLDNAKRNTEKTKYGKQVSAENDKLMHHEMNQRIAENQLAERKNIASTKEARELVNDWNLAPALLNKIMQSTKQFPWWYLLKNDFRHLDGVDGQTGQMLQEFALAMASSPGLNTFGSNVYRSLGPSIEALVHEYTGPYVAAKKIKERQYTKYLGLGEDTGQLQTFWIDHKQRFRAKKKAFSEGAGRPLEDGADDPMTLAEWNVEVSRALIEGKHEIPEVMVAAKPYRDMWNEMGDAAKKLGIYETQKAMEWEIIQIKTELKNIHQPKVSRRNDLGELEEVRVRRKKADMKPHELERIANLEIGMLALQRKLDAYSAAGSKEITDAGYFHIMYDPILLKQKRDEVVDMIEAHFRDNPVTRDGDEIVKFSDADLRARAKETYSSLLKEAEAGEAERGLHSSDKRDWLEARRAEHEEQLKGTPLEGVRSPETIRREMDGAPDDAAASKALKSELKRAEQLWKKLEKSAPELVELWRRNHYIEVKLGNIANGTPSSSAGPLHARDLDIPNDKWVELGVINMDIDTVMAHYVFRMAPAIETARKFGDATGQRQINRIVKRMNDAVDKLRETDPKKADKLEKKAIEYEQSMNDLRDIVHGFMQTTGDPAAITGRVLRALRNFNVLGSMGRSAYMALGDTGNIIVSQGFVRTFGHGFDRMTSGMHGGKIRLMDAEVELAGAASEVALGLRYRSFTETGSQWWAGNAFEKALGDTTQRFFMHNLLGPWTDMASKLAGGMIQSRIVENSIAWSNGKLSPEQAKVMSRLNINKETAKVIASEWKASGALKHKVMFIANTTEWSKGSEWARQIFRAAINDEVRRAVIIPGAVDKPTALLKSEWWKVIGQYKGFGISASNRILAAGIQQEGMSKISGLLSMVGIAFLVDTAKRPDHIQMSLDEQILRAVELSGVTGSILDVNDTIERISAGAVGLRPIFGMDIRERNPNWSNRLGAVFGAVPNQWLTLMYGLTSDEASTNDAARGIRYMIPYNNLWAFNSSVNRIQRAAVDVIED